MAGYGRNDGRESGYDPEESTMAFEEEAGIVKISEQLGDQISDILDSLEQLELRITPVLRPRTPEPENAMAKPVEASSASDLMEMLTHLRNRLRGVSSRVTIITNRVEL